MSRLVYAATKWTKYWAYSSPWSSARRHVPRRRPSPATRHPQGPVASRRPRRHEGPSTGRPPEPEVPEPGPTSAELVVGHGRERHQLDAAVRPRTSRPEPSGGGGPRGPHQPPRSGP